MDSFHRLADELDALSGMAVRLWNGVGDPNVFEDALAALEERGISLYQRYHDADAPGFSILFKKFAALRAHLVDEHPEILQIADVATARASSTPDQWAREDALVCRWLARLAGEFKLDPLRLTSVQERALRLANACRNEIDATTLQAAYEKEWREMLGRDRSRAALADLKAMGLLRETKRGSFMVDRRGARWLADADSSRL